MELKYNVEVLKTCSMYLDKILVRANMNNACKRVKANKVNHGTDGLIVEELQYKLDWFLIVFESSTI